MKPIEKTLKGYETLYKERLKYFIINQTERNSFKVAGGLNIEGDELSGTVTIYVNDEHGFELTPYYDDDENIKMFYHDQECGDYKTIVDVDMILTNDLVVDFQTWLRVVNQGIKDYLETDIGLNRIVKNELYNGHQALQDNIEMFGELNTLQPSKF
jgi:hypothetical protein